MKLGLDTELDQFPQAGTYPLRQTNPFADAVVITN
jgi:hypothetical protein